MMQMIASNIYGKLHECNTKNDGWRRSAAAILVFLGRGKWESALIRQILTRRPVLARGSPVYR